MGGNGGPFVTQKWLQNGRIHLALTSMCVWAFLFGPNLYATVNCESIPTDSPCFDCYSQFAFYIAHQLKLY